MAETSDRAGSAAQQLHFFLGLVQHPQTLCIPILQLMELEEKRREEKLSCDLFREKRVKLNEVLQ